MIRRLKFPRLLLVWSLIGLMLLNGAVRAACQCTDGQSKFFCGKLFERMMLGQPIVHQPEALDCCCENCQVQLAESVEVGELATKTIENRQCRPVPGVIDCRLSEIKNLAGLTRADTLAVDQPNLMVGSAPSSLLALLRDSGGGRLMCVQQVCVLLI